MLQVLLRWLIYSLLLGVVPILAVVVWRYFKTSEFSLTQSVSHGELLLVVSMLNGAAIGEALGSEPGDGVLRLVVVGFAVLLMFLCTLLYAFVASAEWPMSAAEVRRVGRVSKRLFLSGALTSGACVAAGCLS